MLYRFHIYRSCKWINAGRWWQQVYQRSSEFLPDGWQGRICLFCRYKLNKSEDEIDDFNSVWFGLGPDNEPQPVRAGRPLVSSAGNLG